jgi:hypothetical protein
LWLAPALALSALCSRCRPGCHCRERPRSVGALDRDHCRVLCRSIDSL